MRFGSRALAFLAAMLLYPLFSSLIHFAKNEIFCKERIQGTMLLNQNLILSQNILANNFHFRKKILMRNRLRYIVQNIFTYTDIQVCNELFEMLFQGFFQIYLRSFEKKINLKQVTTFKKEIAISITVMRQNEGNRVSFKALACRNSLLVYGSHHVEQVRTLLQCEANQVVTSSVTSEDLQSSFGRWFYFFSL